MAKWLLLILLCLNAHAQATLYGEVNDQSATQAIAQIQQASHRPGSNPVILFIDSEGGSLSAGLKIIDAIQASSKPVYTVCVGVCASMAAIMFTYGAKRAMLPHAVAMFHHERGGEQGSSTQIISAAVLTQRIVTELETHVAKVAHISLAELRLRESDTWWMLADDAVKAHVATEIIQLESYPLPTQSGPGLQVRK